MTRPTVSVVVPVRDVEAYVEQCLASLAAQSMGDLEVIVVDNGSADRTPHLVEQWAQRDDRFRLLREPGGGPGRARNAGMSAARGEFVTFADGDDVVAANAYALLVTTLRETGSDLAAGNFLRLTEVGVRPAYFMGRTFARQRLRTHIRDHHDLIADRTVWNKLYRRDFLRQHELAFAELGAYEDQRLSLPAYFLADAVDVLSETVYYWRIRAAEMPSLSQQRETLEGMRRRLTAVTETSAFLRARFPAEKSWYDESVVRADLNALPRVLATATDTADRDKVLDLAVGWLDQAEPATLDALPAIRRVAWELIRRRELVALAELDEFERTELATTAPVRRWGRWYGAYPPRTDRRLRLPRQAFRVDDELVLSSRIASVAVREAQLLIAGFASVDALPLTDPETMQLAASATPAGSQGPLAVTCRRQARPDLARLEAADLGEHGGYELAVDLAALRAAGPGSWDVALTARVHGLRRTTSTHRVAPLHGLRSGPVPLDALQQLRAELTGAGKLRVHVEPIGPMVRAIDVDDNALRLSGTLPTPVADATLRLRGAAGRCVEEPVSIDAAADGVVFTVTLPVASLWRDFTDPFGPLAVNRPQLETFDIDVVAADGTWGVALHPAAPVAWLPGAGRDWSLGCGRRGLAVLAQRTPRPTMTSIEALDTGGWVVRGSGADIQVWMLVDGDRSGHELTAIAAAGDTFVVELPTAAALGPGTWQLEAGTASSCGGRTVPAGIAVELLATLPRWSEPSGGEQSALGLRGHEAMVLFVPAGPRR